MARSVLFKPFVLGAALCVSLPANAQTKVQAMMPATPSNRQVTSDFTKFIPKPTEYRELDYGMWTFMLENMVVYTGPSTRRRARRPQATTGSRFVRGHTSALRMEGNKVAFSRFTRKNKELITEYRVDLERIANEINIASLPKDEQLAFWLNMHNIIMIEQLATNYPVRRPSALLVGANNTALHDAKLITIQGTRLSLRDIRENIVYRNWDDPIVAYGFFLGDLGSPTIQLSAFTSENMGNLLRRSAEEFVESLRGFQLKRDKAMVSKLYWDLKPFYFKSFEADLTSHFKKYMNDDVRLELEKATTIEMARYETVIADLIGGLGSKHSVSQVVINNSLFNDNSIVKYISELKDKQETLRKQGRINRGSVIIVDIVTPNTEEIPVDNSTTDNSGN